MHLLMADKAYQAPEKAMHLRASTAVGLEPARLTVLALYAWWLPENTTCMQSHGSTCRYQMHASAQGMLEILEPRHDTIVVAMEMMDTHTTSACMHGSNQRCIQAHA